jgi:hypothetical protein
LKEQSSLFPHALENRTRLQPKTEGGHRASSAAKGLAQSKSGANFAKAESRGILSRRARADLGLLTPGNHLPAVRLEGPAANCRPDMDADLSGFNETQRQALLDLLVMSMYLDRHLGSGEDERVKRLLTAMGHDNSYDRQRVWDASVNRVRPHSENAELAQFHTSRLARVFTTRDQCRQVCALLEDLITCDGNVQPAERRFLQQLHDTFQI